MRCECSNSSGIHIYQYHYTLILKSKVSGGTFVISVVGYFGKLLGIFGYKSCCLISYFLLSNSFLQIGSRFNAAIYVRRLSSLIRAVVVGLLLFHLRWDWRFDELSLLTKVKTLASPAMLLWFHLFLWCFSYFLVTDNNEMFLIR